MTFIFKAASFEPPERMCSPMRIPPMGYLTLALLCGELLCVVAWALTGIFFILLLGIVAGVGSVLAAMRWED